jgi:hypothetical protein
MVKTAADIQQITSASDYDPDSTMDSGQLVEIMDLEGRQKQAFRELTAMAFYGRFIDDVLNVNNVDFNLVIQAFPPSMKFTKSFRSHTCAPFLDATIQQSDEPSRQLVLSLYDKRRSDIFSHIQIKQYTHWGSFLPQRIKVNIMVSQYHRFRNLIDIPNEFILEMAICIIKMFSQCAIPLRLLLPRLRRLLSDYRTRYMHGDYLEQPIILFRRIKHYIIWATTPRKDALRRARLQQLIAKTAQKRLLQQ